MDWPPRRAWFSLSSLGESAIPAARRFRSLHRRLHREVRFWRGAQFLTYLGGTGIDVPSSMAVDSSGNIYIGGSNHILRISPLRHAVATHLVRESARSFLAKLSADGSTADLVDCRQRRIVPVSEFPRWVFVFHGPNERNRTPLTKLTGDGQFVTTVNMPAGSASLAIGADGSVYISGSTNVTGVPNVPTVTATPGAWQTTYGGGLSDGFVGKLNPNLSGFAWLTYAGGNGTDYVDFLQLAPGRQPVGEWKHIFV